MNFNRCVPDANNYKNEVKIKSLQDIEIESINFGEIHCWIFKDIFKKDGFEKIKNVIGSFPIQKNNNIDTNYDPNPFDTIHIPAWAYKEVCFLLRDFYLKFLCDSPSPTNFEIFEWGNVYFKDKSRPIISNRLPHIDFLHGIVGNLWLEQQGGESGTSLYSYNGQIINGQYDFMVDTNHRKHLDYMELVQKGRSENWFNFDSNFLADFGFVFEGYLPSMENTMTVYRSNQYHTPFIDDLTNFRWSHTFAFSHR